MEGLSSLINHLQVKGDIQGLAIIRRSSRLNHLLFADYCILFCRATIKEWKNVILLLNLYKEASGQILNMQKNIIFFSNNVGIETQKQYWMSYGQKGVELLRNIWGWYQWWKNQNTILLKD